MLGSLVITPPRDSHPDQPLLGAVCQMCQSALSVPRAKTSIRPSALIVATGSLVIVPPRDSQPDQPLLGAVCQMCQSASSVPPAKTSSRPSSLLSTQECS